jgi:hypothetical protein
MAKPPPRLQAAWRIALAAVAVLSFYGLLRGLARAPWSYDEYYHLGLARLMRSHLRIATFPWAPHSVLADPFADKEPLFHWLLLPFAGLPLETAALLGTLLGQLFLVGSFAFLLWRLAVPRAAWLLLAFCGLGTMFALRMEMCRPHLWLIGFSLLFVGLLALHASWRILLPVAALAGLAHTGGFVTVGFAALWAVAGLASRIPSERRLEWRPVAAAAGGWLLGQLVHPNLPANFRLLWLQNVVVPYQSTAGSDALRSQIGEELTPMDFGQLVEQWPAYLAAALVVLFLLGRPELRTRATLTAALAALGFLVVGTFFLRRFFELGAPLSLLALGLIFKERQARGLPPLLPRAGPVFATVALVAGSLWTWVEMRGHYGFGLSSPPREMALWLGENGGPGEGVFTSQWADSAPLFYSAPGLRSIVALDPTFFFAKDPALFATYAQIVRGRHPDPARAIRERFGSRWVTLWKAPVYRPLAEQLARAPGSLIRFNTRDYLVFDLGAPAAPFPP